MTMTLDPDRLSPRGRFGPTPADHPSIGQLCFVCTQPIEAGQVPTLCSDGPASLEDRQKMLAGRAYNAVASIIHESCAYPDDDPDALRAQVDRLKGALRAVGVNPRLVEEIANGGDPDGGLVVN